MLTRKISTKRNSFLIFLINFLPISILGGFIWWQIHSIISQNTTRIFYLIIFIIGIIRCANVLKNNNRIIKFTEDSIKIFKKNKLLLSSLITEIDKITTDDKQKNIYLHLINNEKIKLLSVKQLGEEIYFKTKAELFRYYPYLMKESQDEYIKKYIETGNLPEYILSKIDIEKSQRIVLLIFEFIFALIPLGFIAISLIWTILEIWIIFLKGLVEILNLFL